MRINFTKMHGCGNDYIYINCLEKTIGNPNKLSIEMSKRHFSVGSDGTDGPTDAAGGYSDGDTVNTLKENGIDIYKVLADNDAYNALRETDGLIITGPTGTNVNDVAVVLINGKV